MSDAGSETSRWWRLAGMVGFFLCILLPWIVQDALAPGYIALGFDAGVYAAGAAAACVAAACLGALAWLRSPGGAAKPASRGEALVLAAVAFFPVWWLFFTAFSGWNVSSLGEASAAQCTLFDCNKKQCTLACTLPDKSTSTERLARESWLPPVEKSFSARVKRGRLGVWMLDKRSVQGR